MQQNVLAELLNSGRRLGVKMVLAEQREKGPAVLASFFCGMRDIAVMASEGIAQVVALKLGDRPGFLFLK